MDKQTLNNLIAGKIFRIPDYQRGYSWGPKQIDDLISDIESLIGDEKIRFHYMGTIVTYLDKENEGTKTYDLERVNICDVVDGQQRLTTIILYLSVVIRILIKKGNSGYERKIPEFLHDEVTNLLTLTEQDNAVFTHLIKTGLERTAPSTPHQKRLIVAVKKFEKHLNDKLSEVSSEKDYLADLFAAITGSIIFTYYEIEEESEIGMTFELMNSRGKGLSILELLKNYLMHWGFRNGGKKKDAFTKVINDSWRDTYINLGKVNGSDDQCLRIAWILYFEHAPKKWKGYQGFKGDNIMPLRDFTEERSEEIRSIITDFSGTLAEISHHYSVIFDETDDSNLGQEEKKWLTNIFQTENIANFLSLIIAARIHWKNKKIDSSKYIKLLKALESFSFRVFLFEGKRSDAGKAKFFMLAHELFNSASPEEEIKKVISLIHGLIRYYSPEEIFQKMMKEPRDWYFGHKRALRYALFEYEKHLLETESKGQKPKIKWEELTNESTLEHILPQTPDNNSHWLKVWSEDDVKKYLHDIGNLVLTKDNSRYGNNDFVAKKGQQGKGHCYSNSDIRQERKISGYPEWDKENLEKRRNELVSWIIEERWNTMKTEEILDINEDDDIDEEAVAKYAAE